MATSTGRSEKIDTNQLIVTSHSIMHGPINVKQLEAGDQAVFNTPVCFNDDVKGAGINCLRIQDDNTDLFNTPHKILNFVGPSVTATDAGNGVANITITGGSGNCISEDDSFMCVFDTVDVPDETNIENSRVTVELSGNELLRLKGNGALQHGYPNVTASGINSLASGGPVLSYSGPTASGLCSQAFGAGTVASGICSFACGLGTTSSGAASHSEGQNTTASGDYSHAEGFETTASGVASHAEGDRTTAMGEGAHAEGQLTVASGDYSHAEGISTNAIGYASHAEGRTTIALGIASHAEGEESIASGYGSHATGNFAHANFRGQWAKANGNFTGTPGALNTHGDAQCCRYILRNWCPAGTSTELFLDGQGGTERINVDQSSSWIFWGSIVARSFNGDRANADDVSSWQFEGVLDRTSSTDSYHNTSSIKDISITPVAAALSNPVFNINGLGQLTITINTDIGVSWHVVACLETVQVKTQSIRIAAE